MLAGFAHRNGLPGASTADGADAFDQHQPADRAEEQHVAQGHEEIELADLAQDAHERHADDGAYDATRDQHQTHFDVDVVASVLRDGTSNGGCQDLHRARANGNS